MEIVFEDNHHLIAVKPAGMATQKHGEAPSLEDEVKEFLKKREGKPGAVFLEPIHRLDKPVSGLVLFAKTSKALSRLQAQMREGKIGRRYLAQVEGNLEGEGELRHFLLKKEHRAEVVSKGTAGAKEAILTFEVTGRGVEIDLQTGRYHQIRAQLAATGHPISGDIKYGAKEKKETIALSCIEISFIHVTQNKKITIKL